MIVVKSYSNLRIKFTVIKQKLQKERSSEFWYDKYVCDYEYASIRCMELGFASVTHHIFSVNECPTALTVWQLHCGQCHTEAQNLDFSYPDFSYPLDCCLSSIIPSKNPLTKLENSPLKGFFKGFFCVTPPNVSHWKQPIIDILIYG